MHYIVNHSTVTPEQFAAMQADQAAIIEAFDRIAGSRVTILVSRTFSEVTPESAEDGDTSDTGFVYEAQPVTFTELVFEILSGGFRDEGGSDWLTARSTDYRTGTEREECLHFDRENPPHLRKWFDLAVRFARSTRRA